MKLVVLTYRESILNYFGEKIDYYIDHVLLNDKVKTSKNYYPIESKFLKRKLLFR